MNHLAKEKSPYLLQHAHNPVDWYPWGEEAFSEAKAQDKPIFLSIGYATCHWCHVMERETFEDPDIAKQLNDVFINIKVDREEHPEVDSIYMEFAQALMSSAGGWPLNLILTSDLKPFFAITYLPPKSLRGLMGMDEFIDHIKLLWKSDERPAIIEQANKLVEIFAHSKNATGLSLPTIEEVEVAVQRFFEIADPVNGGLRGEPKFPLGYQAEFLLSYAKYKSDSRALFYVEQTLDMMQRGGIYDHLGGGFARYAIDDKWRVPHFEKMLYDNAILAHTYLQAWKYTKKEAYADVVRKTCGWMLREMKGSQGGFFSGQDADLEGQEGLYYTWTPLEVKEVLADVEGEVFCQYYGVTHAGNFEGRSVLHIAVPLEDFDGDKEEVIQALEKGRAALLRKRETRPKPFTDDKILTSWNGLAIDAFIHAGVALKEPTFKEAALLTADFIEKNLWKEGKLYHRYRDGEAKYSAGLDDYAYLLKGVLSLYELGFGQKWLAWSIELAKCVIRDFKEIEGAFYQTDGRESLILRRCEFYDGAEPSGNGVMTENFIRLYQITGDDFYLSQAEDVQKAARSYIEMFAPGACYHLLALIRLLDLQAPTVTIFLDAQETSKREIQEALATPYCPHLSALWKWNEKELSFLLCRQDRCERPLTKLDEIVKAIEKL